MAAAAQHGVVAGMSVQRRLDQREADVDQRRQQQESLHQGQPGTAVQDFGVVLEGLGCSNSRDQTAEVNQQKGSQQKAAASPPRADGGKHPGLHNPPAGVCTIVSS